MVMFTFLFIVSIVLIAVFASAVTVLALWSFDVIELYVKWYYLLQTVMAMSGLMGIICIANTVALYSSAIR
jgi:hypothetical protein